MKKKIDESKGKTSKAIIEPLAMKAKKDYGKLKAYLNAVENTSDILKTKDGMRRGLMLLRDMETDPQIFSDLQTRRLKVSSFEWSIVIPTGANAGDAEKEKDAEQKDMLEAQIKRIYRELINEIYDALALGFSVTEMNWEIIDGQLTLPSVMGWDQEEFMFDELWNLMMKTDSSENVGVEIQRVVLATFDKRKGNKYGRSLFTSIFWPWYFKRHGKLFWFTYLDKFGQPTVVGKFPQGTPQKQKDDLLSCCQAIQADMAVTIPQEWVIELLEAKRGGEASTYAEFIRYCDGQISKVILMSSLVTNESQFQTRAATGSQKDVMEECLGNDALWLSDIITNQVVARLAAYNYTFSAAPEFVIHYKTQDTSLNEAQKDKTLQETFPVCIDDLYAKYNLTRPGDEDIVAHNGQIWKYSDLIAKSGQVGQVGQVGRVGQFGQVGKMGQMGLMGQMGHIVNFGDEIEAPGSPPEELDNLVILESDFFEKVIDANLGKIIDTIDVKQTEKLLKNANTYTNAIIEIEKYKSAASAVWENYLSLARLLGEYGVQKELEIAAAVDNAHFADTAGAAGATSGLMELFPGAPFEYGDPKAAIAWLKKKVAVKSDVWKLLSEEAKQAAFFVSELEDLRWIEFVKEKMLEALTVGKTFKQYQKELFEISGTKQFHGYMRTSFQTNMLSALSVQREEALKRSTDMFPFWRYSAVMDKRTRPAHAAMHNYVARCNDPVWIRWRPPVDFNCRCMITVCPNSKVQAYIDAKVIEWQQKDLSLEKLNPEAKFTAISNASHDKMLKELIDQVRVESALLNSAIRKAEK